MLILSSGYTGRFWDRVKTQVKVEVESKVSLICIALCYALVAFSALTLFVGWQEGHPACKKYGGMVEVDAG